LEELSYKAIQILNVSADTLLACCKSLANRNYDSSCKRIIVYFSGHGDHSDLGSTLLMQNGLDTVLISDVMSKFEKTDQATVKMFFVDACRGIAQFDPAFGKGGSQSPLTVNMLLAYATTENYKAYGHSSGSDWTNSLVTELDQSTAANNVFYVLTKVNDSLRGFTRQTAELTSSLTEAVYFKQESDKRKEEMKFGE